ncbi:helix-turn-helix domain-containing protein [Cryobacterium soli]|uniref:helix-turn-helix domain-containing protein n=1 Tax=Cryobacterium soli TaxID=2220095 RepID=UPI0013C3F336|nr:helix-turn-helix transcriptional regulator [Cryobacterium soli]
MDETLNWAEYLRIITDADTNRIISQRTGIPDSTISRWLSGQAYPRPRQVVDVARAYGVNPLNALVGAGYLDQSDIERAGVEPRQFQLREFSELEIAQEIVRRVQKGQSSMLETPLDESHPAMSERSNVTRLRQTPTEDEAEQLGAVAKSGESVIEIDEFDD